MLERRLLAVIAVLVLGAGTLQAQAPAPRDSVPTRARPEVDGLEHSLGTFALTTSIAVSTEIDGNIFADRRELDDRVARLEPAVSLESDWSKHALRLGADVMSVRFDDYPGEDHRNDSLWLDGRLDVHDASDVAVQLRRDRDHEGRESPDDVGGDERTQFLAESVRFSYANHRTRFGVDLNTQWVKLDFDDSFRSADSTRINNDDRDRQDVRATARLGYRVSPGYALFIQASGNSRSYAQQLDDNGFERSSEGSEYGLGFSLDRGVVTSDFFIGQRTQRFDDARFNTIDGLTFGADLVWNVTGLTTLGASARRTVEDTTIVGVSGLDVTRVELVADHELRRNVILSMRLDGRTEKFNGASRRDDLESASITCRYLMNRRLHLVGGYRRESRESSGADPAAFDYAKNMYFIRLQGYL